MKKPLTLLLCFLLSLGLVGCVSVENLSEETALAAADMDAQARNLQKLAGLCQVSPYGLSYRGAVLGYGAAGADTPCPVCERRGCKRHSL